MSTEELASQLPKVPQDMEEIETSPEMPEKLSKRKWFDVNTVFTLLVTGQARSGKGVFIDWIVDTFYRAGFTVIWLFSALGYENLFCVINKDCRARWNQFKQENPDQAKTLLPACMCHDTIPALWMIPNYIEIDQKSLDRFNGVYWQGYDEYNEAYINGHVDSWLPPQFDFTNLKKPAKLRPFPKLITYQFTTPTTPQRSEIFRKEFRKMVEIAKKEHRIILNSPAIYSSDHHGKMEKYHTVAEVLRYIQEELCNDPLFDIVPRIKGKKLTPYEKSNHKIAIIFNELRGACPNEQFMADTEASVSKRATYSFMPERRHAKSWVVGDCQSPTDIHSKVRMQFSEIKAFKRTTYSLIGEENAKFYENIDNLCNNKYIQWRVGIDTQGNFHPERVPDYAKKRLLKQHKLCRISELPDNRVLIKLENGEFKLRKVKFARFHHKADKRDTFEQITGIHWKVNKSKQTTTADEPKNDKKINRKDAKEGYMLRIQQMLKDGKKFEQIRVELKELEDKGVMSPNLNFGEKKSKSINNDYLRWLDKQK